MSDPAAPWWAEVQHLRPRQDDAPKTPAPRTPSRRFQRATQQHAAATATLEHEVADPWAGEDAAWPEPAPWAGDDAERRAPAPWAGDDAERREPAAWDEPADAPRSAGAAVDSWLDDESAHAGTPVWDDSLEEAFAKAPSWTEDEAWMLPKGADRIENGRRTIEIRGQVDRIHGFTAPAETKAATRTGRRPARRPSERFERRPDRVAMWAFLLGVLLICIAAFSKPGDADAATRPAAATPAAHVLVVTADGTLQQPG
jgi:hypothetical protein